MPARYRAIAEKIFDALENDYAGMPECDDGARRSWEETLDRVTLAGGLDDALFWRLMTQRLDALGDGNLSLLAGPGADFTPQTCGFEVRRAGGELWVVDSRLDDRLVRGDAVVAIDGAAPGELVGGMHGGAFAGRPDERQDWGEALAYSSELLVRGADGSLRTLETRSFPIWSLGQPDCSLRVLPDGTCVVCITQLDDLSAAALIVENADAVRAARRVVLDVRACSGGVESMAYPLLNLMFDTETSLRELLGPEQVLTLYTPNNCDRRAEQISQLRLLMADQQHDPGDDTLSWLDENLDVVNRMRGKGMVAETADADELAIAAGPEGQRVLVLTDTATADAAEWLVRVAKKSPRATVVGRPTRGNLDYSNPVTITFEDRFVFTYPMSKTVAAAQGRGIRGIGLEPDVYVAFSPTECTEDVVLARALAL